MSKLKTSWLALKIICLLICLFVVAPSFAIFFESFTANLNYVPVLERRVTLDWYVQALQRKELVNSFGLSVLIAGVVSFISLMLSIPTSLAIVRYRFFGKDLITAMLLSPLMVPAVVTGVSLLQFFSITGSMLARTVVGILLGHLVFCFPYSARAMLASLHRFDTSLEEAAMNLGASKLQTFFRITLPLIKPGAVAALLFSFLISFNNIVITIFLMGPETVTLPVMLFFMVERLFDPVVYAIAAILVIVTTTAVAIVERAVGLYTLAW